MCESEKTQAMPESEYAAYANKKAIAQEHLFNQATPGRLGANTLDKRPPQPTVRQHLQRGMEESLRQAQFYNMRLIKMSQSLLDMTLEEYHKTVNLHPPYDETDAQF